MVKNGDIGKMMSKFNKEDVVIGSDHGDEEVTTEAFSLLHQADANNNEPNPMRSEPKSVDPKLVEEPQILEAGVSIPTMISSDLAGKASVFEEGVSIPKDLPIHLLEKSVATIQK
jgi:hypothetical protein